MALGPERHSPKFGHSTPNFQVFIYFDELNHLLVKVQLVPLLAVHLGLQDVIW